MIYRWYCTIVMTIVCLTWLFGVVLLSFLTVYWKYLVAEFTSIEGNHHDCFTCLRDCLSFWICCDIIFHSDSIIQCSLLWVLLVINKACKQEHKQSKNSIQFCRIAECSGIFLKKSNIVSLMYQVGLSAIRDETLVNRLVRQLLISIWRLYSYLKFILANNKQVTQTASVMII